MNKKSPDSLRRSWGLGRAIQTLPDDGRYMRRKRVINRLKNFDVERAISRVLERRRKWLRLRRTPHPTTEKLPVFIIGCNRSGTNMVCKPIGKSPHGWD